MRTRARMRTRTAGCAFPPDSRKLDHQIETVVYPAFAGRADVAFERGKGRRGTGEDASRISSSCSLIPQKPRFADDDEDTRVPPLVSHVTGDATMCNRRSCATGLIWNAFEVRRIFAPAHRDLNRLRREMGFFNLRFAFPSSLSLSFVRVYFDGYHVAE